MVHLVTYISSVASEECPFPEQHPPNFPLSSLKNQLWFVPNSKAILTQKTGSVMEVEFPISTQVNQSEQSEFCPDSTDLVFPVLLYFGAAPCVDAICFPEWGKGGSEGCWFVDKQSREWGWALQHQSSFCQEKQGFPFLFAFCFKMKPVSFDVWTHTTGWVWQTDCRNL